MGYVRATDPQTSKDAARRPRTTARTRLLQAFAEHQAYGLTVAEAAMLLGAEKGTTDRRRAELVEQGFVIDSCQQRATNTGAAAIVWTITREGLEAARAGGGGPWRTAE